MKTVVITRILPLFFLLAGWTAAYSQDQPEVPGDQFSLEGALELFKKSSSPEEFERMLNSEDSKVNNLDLNGDGYIDYIRVVDRNEGNVHLFILQAVISKTESQDVAVIELEKQENGKAVLQITGNEDIYGVETIIEPTREVQVYAGTTTSRTVVNVWAWPCVQYIYSPFYASIWISPWGWSGYPVWWHPWRPVAYYVYDPWWRPYRSYYSVCYTHRVVYAPRIYRSYRTTSVIVHDRHYAQVSHYRSTHRYDNHYYGSRNGRDRNDRGWNRNDNNHHNDGHNNDHHNGNGNGNGNHNGTGHGDNGHNNNGHNNHDNNSNGRQRLSASDYYTHSRSSSGNSTRTYQRTSDNVNRGSSSETKPTYSNRPVTDYKRNAPQNSSAGQQRSNIPERWSRSSSGGNVNRQQQNGNNVNRSSSGFSTPTRSTSGYQRGTQQQSSGQQRYSIPERRSGGSTNSSSQHMSRPSAPSHSSGSSGSHSYQRSGGSGGNSGGGGSRSSGQHSRGRH